MYGVQFLVGVLERLRAAGIGVKSDIGRCIVLFASAVVGVATPHCILVMGFGSGANVSKLRGEAWLAENHGILRRPRHSWGNRVGSFSNQPTVGWAQAEDVVEALTIDKVVHA